MEIEVGPLEGMMVASERVGEEGVGVGCSDGVEGGEGGEEEEGEEGTKRKTPRKVVVRPRRKVRNLGKGGFMIQYDV